VPRLMISRGRLLRPFPFPFRASLPNVLAFSGGRAPAVARNAMLASPSRRDPSGAERIFVNAVFVRNDAKADLPQFVAFAEPPESPRPAPSRGSMLPDGGVLGSEGLSTHRRLRDPRRVHENFVLLVEPAILVGNELDPWRQLVFHWAGPRLARWDGLLGSDKPSVP
jgi:hypothetical protein